MKEIGILVKEPDKDFAPTKIPYRQLLVKEIARFVEGTIEFIAHEPLGRNIRVVCSREFVGAPNIRIPHRSRRTDDVLRGTIAVVAVDALGQIVDLTTGQQTRVMQILGKLVV